jgi:histidyl-tRNA synthetase
MAAFHLAEQLRDAGIDIDLPTAGAVGKKLKKADKAGIRLALILGSDERAKGSVQLRDLATGTQATMPLDDKLAAVITDSLQAP